MSLKILLSSTLVWPFVKLLPKIAPTSPQIAILFGCYNACRVSFCPWKWTGASCIGQGFTLRSNTRTYEISVICTKFQYVFHNLSGHLQIAAVIHPCLYILTVTCIIPWLIFLCATVSCDYFCVLQRPVHITLRQQSTFAPLLACTNWGLFDHIEQHSWISRGISLPFLWHCLWWENIYIYFVLS